MNKQQCVFFRSEDKQEWSLLACFTDGCASQETNRQLLSDSPVSVSAGAPQQQRFGPSKYQLATVIAESQH